MERHEFQTVIGLEIHAALDVKSKLFCGCSVMVDAPPNTHVCPVCLGLPGALPVLNRAAVERGLRVALALQGQLADEITFDRKHYFYPDLPKGYQITQRRFPLARDGVLAVAGKPIAIRELHLEEDAGKSFHEVVAGGTGLDFNRSGVALLEIVTEPVLQSSQETRLWVAKLQELLRSIGASQARMEWGELRFDTNVNLRWESGGVSQQTPISEIKNLNSLRALERAVDFEVRRHRHAALNGCPLVRETRHWDEIQGCTLPARVKEGVVDYWYLAEPDLPSISLDRLWVAAVQRSLPENPQALRLRLQAIYALDEGEVEQLLRIPGSVDYFEATVAAGSPSRLAFSWVIGELAAYRNATGIDLSGLSVAPAQLSELLQAQDAGQLTRGQARELWMRMAAEGVALKTLLPNEEAHTGIVDRTDGLSVCAEVIQEHASVARDYRRGKHQALNFLVGQVMRVSRGQLDPQLAKQWLQDLLEGEVDDEDSSD